MTDPTKTRKDFGKLTNNESLVVTESGVVKK